MDTCAFLKNTSEHMGHLMIKNFQEMYDHIKGLIERKSDLHMLWTYITFSYLLPLLIDSSTHIFFDLGDSSEANSLEELERILDNLPEALQLMEQLETHEKELRYNTDNLVDSK